jgi:outer membrane lipoprotein SlyB
MRIIRAALVCLTIGTTLALGACGPSYSPDTYSSSAVQQAAKVETGVIVGVRRVDVETSGAVGAATGAAAGGIAGSQTPGGSVGSAFGALGGALVGGLIGTAAEKASTENFAYEYIVRKPGGELVSVTQKDSPPLTLGTHVLVIAGTQARIVRDYTVPAVAETPPGATPPVASGSPAREPADNTAPFTPPVTASPLPPPAASPSPTPAIVPPAPSPPLTPSAAAAAGASALSAGVGTPPPGIPSVPDTVQLAVPGGSSGSGENKASEALKAVQ